MKRLLTISVLAIVFATIVGCEEKTGLVFVDYDAAEKAGIVVTNFYDNPITATIEYDYSKIENFSTSNLSVTLARTVIPLDDWKAGRLSMYTKRQIELQKKLMSLTTVGNESIAGLKPKAAKIKENVPGKLKLVSLNDIGVYRIEYKK